MQNERAARVEVEAVGQLTPSISDVDTEAAATQYSDHEDSLDQARPFPFEGQVMLEAVRSDQPLSMTPKQFVDKWLGQCPQLVTHPDADLLMFLSLQARDVILLPDASGRRAPAYSYVVLRCAHTDSDGEPYENIYWDQWDGFAFYAPVVDWLWHERKTKPWAQPDEA